MKLLFLSALISVCASLTAQNVEGKITYQENRKIDFDESRFGEMSEERKKMMRERMEKFGKAKKVLIYTATESLYRNFDPRKDAKDESGWDNPEANSRWKMMRPQARMYRNISEQSAVQQVEMFDKKFLIVGEEQEYKWKMTGKQEKVLDYVCQQAVWQKNDSTVVTAWFAPQIPVATGPWEYAGLPGMILKFDVNDGELTAVATEIEFKSPEEGDIEEPTKGKEVTREEFEAIVKEKMEEMRQMYGGGKGRGH